MDSINQHIRKFSIVLDTNVLYAAPVRDIILRLAEKKLFQSIGANRSYKSWVVT